MPSWRHPICPRRPSIVSEHRRLLAYPSWLHNRATRRCSVEQLRSFQGAYDGVELCLHLSNPRELGSDIVTVFVKLSERPAHFIELVAVHGCAFPLERGDFGVDLVDALKQGKAWFGALFRIGHGTAP